MPRKKYSWSPYAFIHHFQFFLDRIAQISLCFLYHRTSPYSEAIEEWEPRATYKDMTLFFDPSNPGKLAFTVQIEIKAGDSA